MSLLGALFQKGPWKGWKPFARKSCPVCKGQILFRRCGGATPEGRRWDGIETICPSCGKNTVEDPWVPDNDNPVEKVTPNAKGWVVCPCCGIRFQPTDKGVFRTGRHRRCGQLIIVDGL